MFDNWMDFDIAFCRGEDLRGNICPKRTSCHRYWSDMTAKQAQKLGIKYNSFMAINDVEGCESYVKER